MAVLGITTLRLAINRSSVFKWAMIGFFTYLAITYAVSALFDRFAFWVKILAAALSAIAVYLFFEITERLLRSLLHWLYPHTAEEDACAEDADHTPLLLVATSESAEGVPHSVSLPAAKPSARNTSLEAKLDTILRNMKVQGGENYIGHSQSVTSGKNTGSGADTASGGETGEGSLWQVPTAGGGAAAAAASVHTSAGSSSPAKKKANGNNNKKKSDSKKMAGVARCIE